MNNMRVGARGPVVTDNALLRFLQHSGMYVEGVRAAIAGSLAVAHSAAKTLGGSDHLIVVDGLSFVVRNGSVTTVMRPRTSRDRHRALTQAPRR